MSSMDSGRLDVTEAIAEVYSDQSSVVLSIADRLDFLGTIPDESAALVVTSPPYNVGKEYEQRQSLDTYLAEQRKTIREACRILEDSGNLCWIVGNSARGDVVVPLDVVLYPLFVEIGLKLRNRVIWYFRHGLHAKRRFSGRYETILWFSKTDSYCFDLDAVRVPQQYPGKRSYKGPSKGNYSGHPAGKNPSDIWDIPNVKANHVEKTAHPCQYPVELVERLIRGLTPTGSLVVDPYIGSGTTAVAAILNGRRVAGSDRRLGILRLPEREWSWRWGESCQLGDPDLRSTRSGRTRR